MRAVIGGLAGRFFEAREEVDRIERHLDIDWCGELSSDTAHAFAGRSQSLLLFALDNYHIGTSLFSQVVGNARADDPTSDNNNICSVAHLLTHLINLHRETHSN